MKRIFAVDQKLRGLNVTTQLRDQFIEILVSLLIQNFFC